MINFDFPISVTDYIHRVGRTGRVRTVPRQDDVAMATSLMSHNRDVRMALAIEVCIVFFFKGWQLVSSIRVWISTVISLTKALCHKIYQNSERRKCHKIE